MLSFLKSPFFKYIKTGIIILIPFSIYLLPLDYNKEYTSLCIYKNLIGWECPGCGITHSFFAMAHLDFAVAWDFNKMAFFVAPILLYLWIKLIFKNIKGIKNLKT